MRALSFTLAVLPARAGALVSEFAQTRVEVLAEDFSLRERESPSIACTPSSSLRARHRHRPHRRRREEKP